MVFIVRWFYYIVSAVLMNAHTAESTLIINTVMFPAT